MHGRLAYPAAGGSAAASRSIPQYRAEKQTFAGAFDVSAEGLSLSELRVRWPAPRIRAMSPVGAILNKHRGHGPGFDALRVYLSISVLSWHSIAICYGGGTVLRVWNAPYGRLFIILLPMFFALSGFLVMGSAVRLGSLRHFMANRFLRIFPALATEITISALILGPLVTVLPLADYFSSPVLLAYFGSLVGRVQFVLPGVFLNNPLPGVVNGNLWTIPPEILCYLFMAAMIAMGLFKERGAVTVSATGVLALNLLQDYMQEWGLPDGLLPARYLVLCFAFGTALYMWRDMLPYRWPLFAGAAVLGLAFLRTPGFIHLSLFALTYCTVFLGVTPLPKGRLFAGGDYSYGIYLFGAPIQQTIAWLYPATHQIYWNIPISLTLTVGVAALSWHLVEKRALALRQFISNSDGILRRSFLARYAVLAGVVAYALALVRISDIGFRGEIGFAKLTIAAGAIAAIAFAAAGVPLLRAVKRPVPVAALAGCCFFSIAAGAIIDRVIVHIRRPAPNVTAAVHSAVMAFTEYQRAFPRQASTVMFGDSLTGAADWQAILGSTDIVNRGVGGDTTATALARIDTVLSAKPRRVFLMFGINDLRDGMPVPEIVGNYRAIIHAIVGAGAIPIVQSTVKVAAEPNPLVADAAEVNRQVTVLNEQLRAMCAAERCQFLDLNSVLDSASNLPASFTYDGLHLTAAAYRAWAAVLAPYFTAQTTVRSP
jgi:peptidoglycan/LPS O-acetylase OafA/YrhL/lysophospholipase L1-like esterase